MRTANERSNEARQAKNRRAAEIQANTGRPATEEELQAETEELARAEASEAAARAENEQAGAALQRARLVFSKACNALAKLIVSGAKFRQKPVKLGRGSPDAELALNLSEQNESRAEFETDRNSGTPLATYKEQIAKQLEEALGRDPFKVAYLEGEAKWRHPVVSLPAVHKLDGRVVATDDLVPLMVTLFGDEIRQRLFDRIDRDHRGDTTLRLPADEKKARLTKLRAEILELQYVEGALRVLLAGDAPEIAFRPEMAPLAILGIEVIG
jgi:hypothetical protein